MGFLQTESQNKIVDVMQRIFAPDQLCFLYPVLYYVLCCVIIMIMKSALDLLQTVFILRQVQLQVKAASELIDYWFRIKITTCCGAFRHNK